MADFSSDPMFHAARAAFAAQRFAAARDLCEQMLRQSGKNIHAIMLLSEIARCTQRPKEELEHVTRAVKLNPKSAELRYHLGRVYMDQGRYPQALGQYDKALKLDPALVKAVVGKAAVWEFRNNHKKARGLLEPLHRAQPTSPAVAMRYLPLLLHDGETERAIEVGRRVVEAGTGSGEALRETWFALARAHERAGDFDAAFAAAAAGNALQPEPFEPAEYRRMVDACIETFTPERMAPAPRAEPSSLPVFIVGVPRCGSTLTERIIDSHPRAFGAGELLTLDLIVRDLSIHVASVRPYPACAADFTAEEVQTLSGLYLDEVRALAPAAERITDKALGNFHHLGLLDRLFPGARVIHCRRDPVDALLSCFMNPFGAGQFAAGSDLRNLGLYHREYERLMRHWTDVIDLPVLEVEYETLVADQEGTSRRIIEFCNLEWDDACLRFHEREGRDKTLSYEQVRKPIYRTSVGRAERFGARLDPLRAALAGDAG